MSIACKFERSILSCEHEIIMRSHQPEIYDASFPPRSPSGDTAGEGMRLSPNERRPTRVPPARIGKVSQATKNARTACDARNRGTLHEAEASRSGCVCVLNAGNPVQISAK